MITQFDEFVDNVMNSAMPFFSTGPVRAPPGHEEESAKVDHTGE